MTMKLTRQGQSTVEMAVLVAVIVSALLVMQIYMKRAAMGKLRDSTDQLGEQFEPDALAGITNVGYKVTRNELSSVDGGSTTRIDAGNDETRTRDGNEFTTSVGGIVDGRKLY